MLIVWHCMYTIYDVSRAAFDKLSGDLSQKVDTATSEIKNLSEVVAVSLENSPGSSSTPSNRALVTLLATLKMPPPLDQKDFKKVEHWFSDKYKALRKGAPKTEDATEDDLLELEEDDTDTKLKTSKKKKKDPTLPCFLEDKDGKLTSAATRSAISAMMRSFWEHLQEQGKAPKTSRKVTIDTKLQFQMLMESNFECLRYCDSHWKTDQLWIAYYPSWLKGVRRKLAEQKRKEEEEAAKRNAAIIDVDNEDNENTDDANKDIEDGKDANNKNTEDTEDTGKKNNNKRGALDGGETSKPKRARVAEPNEPAPARITTTRARVRVLYPLTTCLYVSLTTLRPIHCIRILIVQNISIVLTNFIPGHTFARPRPLRGSLHSRWVILQLSD